MAATETTRENVKEEGSVIHLNFNTASRKELEALPGIGETLAGRIVEGGP